MRRLEKYKVNLRVHDEFVHNSKIYSYNTHVADINHKNRTIKPNGNSGSNGRYSRTTSKHINYVAQEFGYKVIKY